MNDFASTTNTGILKNNYQPESASNAMKEAIRRRKAKMADQGHISMDPNYTSKNPEDNSKD